MLTSETRGLSSSDTTTNHIYPPRCSLASNFGTDSSFRDLCTGEEGAEVVAALCEMLKVNTTLRSIK